jgi:hypothetical protein
MIFFIQVVTKTNRLFDYKDSNGINVMQFWANGMSMQKRDRGRLDSKIDLLERAGDTLPPKLLHSIRRHKTIMHLVVNGEVALRPMLCRGPFNMQKEFTFLFGTAERDRKFAQRDAPERAERNRQDLISNPQNRCKHERFGKEDQTDIQR